MTKHKRLLILLYTLITERRCAVYLLIATLHFPDLFNFEGHNKWGI